MRCSESNEKPSNSPPHPAKRKSMPTKNIINLVGMVAVDPSYNTAATRLRGVTLKEGGKSALRVVKE